MKLCCDFCVFYRYYSWRLPSPRKLTLFKYNRIKLSPGALHIQYVLIMFDYQKLGLYFLFEILTFINIVQVISAFMVISNDLNLISHLKCSL